MPYKNKFQLKLQKHKPININQENVTILIAYTLFLQYYLVIQHE